MPVKHYHRILGIILLLPLLCWALTGLVFFIKPGYGDAYQQLAIKTYPLDKTWTISTTKQWQDIRLVKTILGTHLLVTSSGETTHLDSTSLKVKPIPSSQDLTALLQDAISTNKARYGSITSIDENIATTNTGVKVTIDWNTLELNQRGEDTELIGLIYKIHYLQWTSSKPLNKVLGFTGLFLLMSLTTLGLILTFRKNET